MFQPQQIQDTNPIRGYILAMAAVVMVAASWIIFNEVVMGIGDVALNMVTTGPGNTILYSLIMIYRVTPIFMIIAVWVWCFYRAFKREPFEQFGG